MVIVSAPRPSADPTPARCRGSRVRTPAANSAEPRFRAVSPLFVSRMLRYWRREVKMCSASGSCSARVSSRAHSTSRIAWLRLFSAVWRRLLRTWSGEHSWRALNNRHAAPQRRHRTCVEAFYDVATAALLVNATGSIREPGRADPPRCRAARRACGGSARVAGRDRSTERHGGIVRLARGHRREGADIAAKHGA